MDLAASGGPRGAAVRMLAETARWHRHACAREEVCACHEEKFLGRKKLSSLYTCLTKHGNKLLNAQNHIPPTCTLSDHAIFNIYRGSHQRNNSHISDF